jgi:hypothetical protein
MPDATEGGTGKARKRVAAKAATRQAVTKVKSTVHLSVEASQRLDIHATMMGLDRSALVEKLINDHLRRYVVSDRGGADGSAGSDAAAVGQGGGQRVPEIPVATSGSGL